jgi:phage shock protein A
VGRYGARRAGYDRPMARTRTAKQNDILARFTELGHEALNRLTEVPGGSKVVEMLNETKTRLDEMQKKLRGLDELEKRVAKLEKQLAAQAKPTTSSTRKAPARRPATPKKPPA